MGGKIYVTGGRNQGETLVNTVYVYHPQADAWKKLGCMGIARRYHASTAVGGKLYVFGGWDDEGETLNTAEVYDPASGSWAQGPSLTSARDFLAAVAL